MKETTEFMVMPAKLTDSTVVSLKDGNFEPLKDFQNYFDDLLHGNTAFQGMDKIKDEQINAKVPDLRKLRGDLETHMPNLEERDRYDVATILDGFLAIYRFGVTAGYKKRQKEEAAESRTNRR